MMIVECIDRRGERHEHRCSDEFTAKEAMERLGVYQRPFKVSWWPEHHPGKAALIQDFEQHKEVPRVVGGTVATKKQVRQHFEALGYIVRVGHDGHVTYRAENGPWLEGRFVEEYRVIDGTVVHS